MLNPKTSERELAYLVKVNDVIKHGNADRLEIAVIGGWHVIVGKGEFQKGEVGIYFEIDSLLPDKEPFHSMEFLASKHFRIKTQKIRGELSQGFLIHLKCLKGTEFEDLSNIDNYNDENRFLTERLEVKYYEPEYNERKNNNNKQVVDKYKRMISRHRELFMKYLPFKWMIQYPLGQKLLYIFFGRKTDELKAQWPSWVRKTDEERIQNMKWILQNKDRWIVTEKVDGTSLTVAFHKQKGIFICSRNLAFYDTDENLYTSIAKSRKIPEALQDICDEYKLNWVTFQGEIYGKCVQKNEYFLPYQEVLGFNLVFSDRGRLNSVVAENIMSKYNISWVPILKVDYILPDTVEELMQYVENEGSQLANVMREGLVFRSPDGIKSFKAVSNKYLLKYHG